jgi:hypothetical protein
MIRAKFTSNISEKRKIHKNRWKLFFTEVQAYMRSRISKQFTESSQGGLSRGVTWLYFADQYTRKTDGVTVPAWGGVPRLDGKGNVLGRKRHGAPRGWRNKTQKRVKFGDKVMQNTRALYNSLLSVSAIKNGGNTIWLYSAKRYETYQDRLRPYLFFMTPELNHLQKRYLDHANKYL